MRGLGSGHVTCGPMRGLEKNCTRWHIHTHKQNDRQTHGHGDSMTDPAQRAESVKTAPDGTDRMTDRMTNRQTDMATL